MLNIKVLGPGCANCRKLEEVAREAVAATGVEAEITKVTDMGQIVAYDVLTFLSGLAGALLVGGAFTRWLWPLGAVAIAVRWVVMVGSP